jgi:DNA-binding HxlR family transcriptional regulator
MQRDLGIARNLLTDRLNKLVANGVLEKRIYQAHPPRYEYRLTQKGIDLSPALVALMRWGDQWLAGGRPPVELVHERCGQPLDQVFVCWECDETVSPLEIRSTKQRRQEPA